MKLIYFHGFGSSAQSGTIRTLREMLPDFEVIAPDIPVDPADALPFLKQLCEDEQPDVVIGTSMGGMYAQQMFGFNRICVNPAFEMSVKSKVLDKRDGSFYLVFLKVPVCDFPHRVTEDTERALRLKFAEIKLKITIFSIKNMLCRFYRFSLKSAV